MVVWYVLRVSARWPSRRVAFSTPTTSTPVAMGSSVPAWPTRRVPARRRIRATTSCEVSPAGLSTMTSPLAGVTGRLGALAGGGQRRVRGPGLRHQLLHVLCALGQGVAHEGQRRGVPEPGLAAHLGPDQPGGAGQRRRAARLLLGRPVDGVV